MSAVGSVTLWVSLIKESDPAAVQALWERYYPRLVRLARKKLDGVRRAVADEEDVAASALKSFYLAAKAGRFPNLADRDSLWRLLLQMTARKVIDLRRREGRLRRGGGKLLGESAIADPAKTDGELRAIDGVIGNEPDPEFASIMVEQYQQLLDKLGDPELRAIAIGAMEGYSNEEIAQRLNCALRTIERRRELIRKKWKRELQP